MGIPYQNISIEEIQKNLFLENKGKLYKGKFASNNEITTNFGEESFFIFNIKRKIYEFESNVVNLIYKCDDYECNNFPNNTFLDISIVNENYEIIHNASNPIKKSECTPFISEPGKQNVCNYLISNEFHDKKTLSLDFKLSSILYEEKKGISRLFDYISGQDKKYRTAFIEDETKIFQYNLPNFAHIDDEIYYHIANINTIPIDKYEKYLRSEIGFLSVLANIGALFSTLKVVFVVVYQFYSKKFDNYEVIEKILETELQKDKINKNLIKLSEKNKDINSQMELSEVNAKEKENNIDNMIIPLIKSSTGKEKDIDVKEVINSEEKISEEKNEENALINEEDRILPKISFFEFYFNNIYFKICKRRKNQEIVNICDKIIYKYISIDSVLYNLIRLENLFKDYRWNNPELNSLKNNEIIRELLEIL